MRAVPGVAAVEGSVNGEALLVDQKGKAIVFGGAPNLGFSIANPQSPFNVLRLEEGAWPHGNEVVIGKSTADRKHFHVGDTIGVQAEGPVQKLKISGLVTFGTAASLGGATLAGFDLPTAQRLFDKQGKLDEIAVAGDPKVADSEILRRVKAVLPSTAQARLGSAQAREGRPGHQFVHHFLRGFLLAFGGIALFVGSFVIANSLSITIAQRTRELATMRTLGASRRQVLTSIIVEALVIGFAASVVGLFLGLALAKGLFRLFDLVGFTLPNNGLTFATRTIVLSHRSSARLSRCSRACVLRSGRHVCLRSRPCARDRPCPLRGSRAIALPVPSCSTAAGFAALLYGLFGSGLSTTGILVWMGIGALLIFFGVAMLAVRIVQPFARLLGWPATKIGGAAGSLARDNARRNPQRTASTASALMIGLALVTLVAVLAAGITHSFRGAVDKIWRNADYAITAQNNFSPIPPAAADTAAKSPVVDAVGNVRTGDAEAFGSGFFATAVNPAASTMFTLDWSQGSQQTMAQLGENGAFVDKGYAKSHHLSAARRSRSPSRTATARRSW